MSVFCVFEEVPWEGSYLVSIWDTEELAQKEVDRLKAKRPQDFYCEEEWEVECDPREA